MDSHYSRGDNRSGFNYILWLDLAILLLCLLAYSTNQYIVKHITDNIFLHCYFNDMLAPPILLSATNIFISLTPKHSFLFITPVKIISITMGAGLFWELVTPTYRIDSVADSSDLVAYLIGGLLYYLIISDKKRVAAIAN